LIGTVVEGRARELKGSRVRREEQPIDHSVKDEKEVEDC